MNDFEFFQPRSLAEALEAISRQGRVVPLAGGTNLLVNLKRGPLAADLLVDLSRLRELRDIASLNGKFQLGAGVTFTDLLQWRPGGAVEGLLRPMAAAFAGPLIRNLATVGGNLCDGSPAADLSPPLLALGAQLRLESARQGPRCMTLEEFFLGPRQTARRPEELLTAIEIPQAEGDDRWFYYKLGKRRADAISIVSVALAARLESGRVKRVRIALGAVAPMAMRAREAEDCLLGETLTDSTISAAAAAAAAEARPIDDFRASAAYRRRMVEVLVRRGLTRLRSRG